MSFKKFSSAQTSPGKNGPVDKAKKASPAGQPMTQPDQNPAEVVPAPKS